MTITHPDTGCPDTGRLRSWLDGEAQPAEDAFADHLADCDACQRTLDTLSRTAMVVARALAVHPEAAPSADETERALASVHRRLADDVHAFDERIDDRA